MQILLNGNFVFMLTGHEPQYKEMTDFNLQKKSLSKLFA